MISLYIVKPYIVFFIIPIAIVVYMYWYLILFLRLNQSVCLILTPDAMYTGRNRYPSNIKI